MIMNFSRSDLAIIDALEIGKNFPLTIHRKKYLCEGNTDGEWRFVLRKDSPNNYWLGEPGGFFLMDTICEGSLAFVDDYITRHEPGGQHPREFEMANADENQVPF